jgi:hypothetical protein
MSQRKNKNRNGRKGSKLAGGDNSPPSEAASDISPSDRNLGDDAGSVEVIEREFVESGDVPTASQAFEHAAVSETAEMYNELIRSPEEPVSMESKATADTDAVQVASDNESTLPTGVENANASADSGDGFFKSFFACCVGRK